MKGNRDEFKSLTKEILAKRVGYLCSNPACQQLTVGANSEFNKSTSIGIAAHITAASAGGPRFDENLTNEERAHIENGIWLCSNCANLIDTDKGKYSVDILQDWKKRAEEETGKKLSGVFVTQKKGVPFLEADLIWKNGGRYNQGYSSKNPTQERDGEKVYIIEDKPIIYWELVWKFNFLIFNNSNYPAYNVSVESIGKQHFSHVDKLHKVNNLPPFQNIDLVANFSDTLEGNHIEANEVLKHKIPKKFDDLVLKMKYYDDDRVEHVTYVRIKGGEIINSKE